MLAHKSQARGHTKVLILALLASCRIEWAAVPSLLCSPSSRVEGCAPPLALCLPARGAFGRGKRTYVSIFHSVCEGERVYSLMGGA
jgi:hypothetical protein